MRLLVLLTDSALFFLILRNHNFEQHYVPVVLFGSVLAALMIVEWERAIGQGRASEKPGYVGLLLAVLLMFSTAATTVHSQRKILKRNERIHQELFHALHAFRHGKDTDEPDAFRDWLKERSAYFDPFMYRPKEQRDAQFRFLLERSKPGDILLSDWLNPPYRNLPAGYNHGYMMSLFYASRRLHTDARLRGLVRRYDPYYAQSDPTEADHMIRLLEAVPVRLILLDGSLAKLFSDSDRFFQWVSDRYQFVLEQKSGSVFALLRESG